MPSFHSRVPSRSKQYTEEEASPAKTKRPPGEVAHEYTVLSQRYVVSTAPVAFDSRWTTRCTVPAYTASSSCQPKSTPPRVGVCHNSVRPSGEWAVTPPECPWYTARSSARTIQACWPRPPRAHWCSSSWSMTVSRPSRSATFRTPSWMSSQKMSTSAAMS